jgi:hypothetical protein
MTAGYSPIYTSATNVYSKTGLSVTECNLSSDDILRNVIEDAEIEVEALTGRKWTNGVSKTEYFDGAKSDVLSYTGQKATTINLSKYPIQTITEFKVYDVDGTVTETYATLASGFSTVDYWLDTMDDMISNTVVAYGKITLKEDEFPTGNQNIKVAYTYGYTTVPVMIRNLATCLAGIRAWIAVMGGNYNFINSYSIPQQNVSKGDFYDRGMKNIENLKEEANRILDLVGRRPRVLFFSTGANR